MLSAAAAREPAPAGPGRAALPGAEPASAEACRFQTLWQGLEHHARYTPSAPAVEADGVTWSYADLAQRTRVLAAALRSRGVGAGQRVVVLAGKSCDTVSALYAILGLGAAYVPVSSDWPIERVRWIGRDVAPAAWVVDADGRQRLGEADAPVIDLQQADAGGGEDAGGLSKPSPDSLAYIIYTSGSTGDPKGVMHSHQSALAFVRWAVHELRLVPGDRFAAHAPFHFDLSILDLYAASYVGATLVLPPGEVAAAPRRYVKWLLERRVTVSYSVPGVWVEGWPSAQPAAARPPAARPPAEHPPTAALRRIVYAGEPMAPKHAAALQAAFPQAELYNFYGPTETNVCTSYKLPVLDASALPEQIPIGTACSGNSVELDDGELVVRGESVLLGYWGRPPRAPGDAYRTGDLARWDEALGGYVFLGRRDGQRKLRGFRVELGEVEACLYRHASSAEVVAAIDDRDAHHPVLVAFVVATDGAPRDSMALERHCALFLPPYMVPRIIWRDSLPRTSTGKVDRRRLEAELKALAPAEPRASGG